MCIEPPLPLQTPVERPKSSAIMAFTSTPLAMQWPWPRCVDDDPVAVGQMAADADRDRLLARVEVEKAGQRPRHDKLGELVLEDADRAHAPVGIQQCLSCPVHEVLLIFLRAL